MTPAESALAHQPLVPPFRIKVLGLGGAGCNAVSHLARETFDGVSFAVLNTDARSLEQCHVTERIVLGVKSSRGLGAGGDPLRGRAAAEEESERIRQLCLGADVVLVVAGLGGGTGTGASPVLAREARQAGALVLGVVILPFECEGARRQEQAQAGLEELKREVDGVICLPNQRVFKLIDDRTPLPEAFAITHELIAQGVRGLWRWLSRPGLINVDFADLRTVTQGRHTESLLATAEARGESRAREVVEKLMAHPLLEGGQALNESAAVLVCIAGGPDLTMAEVTRVMEEINRQSEHAHLIMGAAIDEGLGDRLSVTLVASRAGEGSDAPAPATLAEANRLNFAGGRHSLEFDERLLESSTPSRPPSRLLAPAPMLTPDRAEALLKQQGAGNSRQRKQLSRLRQGQLALEVVSKGRFEKSEPTIRRGEDLDVPTYIRRGVALN